MNGLEKLEREALIEKERYLRKLISINQRSYKLLNQSLSNTLAELDRAERLNPEEKGTKQESRNSDTNKSSSNKATKNQEQSHSKGASNRKGKKRVSKTQWSRLPDLLPDTPETAMTKKELPSYLEQFGIIASQYAIYIQLRKLEKKRAVTKKIISGRHYWYQRRDENVVNIKKKSA